MLSFTFLFNFQASTVFKLILVSLLVFQIQLLLGIESSISVGWQKKDERMSAAGELKVNALLLFSMQNSHSH